MDKQEMLRKKYISYLQIFSRFHFNTLGTTHTSTLQQATSTVVWLVKSIFWLWVSSFQIIRLQRPWRTLETCSNSSCSSPFKFTILVSSLFLGYINPLPTKTMTLEFVMQKNHLNNLIRFLFLFFYLLVARAYFVAQNLH